MSMTRSLFLSHSFSPWGSYNTVEVRGHGETRVEGHEVRGGEGEREEGKERE